MAAAAMISRVLGMVREIVYSHFMGDKWVASAFVNAFLMPNLFRRLLGEGALTGSFIPIFKEKEKNSTPAEMWRAVNAVVCGLVVVAGAVVGLAILGLSISLAMGHHTAESDLMLRLTRLMFPYMLLVCVAAIFMGILNARGHFFIPAMGTAVMNVVLICSVWFLAPRMGAELHQKIYGLAIGVLLAGVAQVVFQWPTLRREGFRLQWVTPWSDPTVRRVARQMIPGTVAVATYQLNVVITQNFAFWVDRTLPASFNYAVRLMELPQGVFGATLATVLLPLLSGLAVEKKYDEFRGAMRQGLEHLIFINLLASVLLVILGESMIRLLFQHGAFDEASTAGSTLALVWLAPGLLLFSINNIFARAFFALGDTKTPVRISVFCMVVNLILALALVRGMRQGGLALANSTSAAVNCGLLVYALRRRLGHLDLSRLRGTLVPAIGAVVVAGAVAWGLRHWWVGAVGHVGVVTRLGEVFVPIAGATLVYFAITWKFRVAAALEMGNMVLKRLGLRPRLAA